MRKEYDFSNGVRGKYAGGKYAGGVPGQRRNSQADNALANIAPGIPEGTSLIEEQRKCLRRSEQEIDMALVNDNYDKYQSRVLDRLSEGIVGNHVREDLVNNFAGLMRENDILRGIVAKADIPCVYCQLPKADMGKCQHGFPGCSRGDDMICDPASAYVGSLDPEAERQGLARLGPGDLTRFRHALKVITKSWPDDVSGIKFLTLATSDQYSARSVEVAITLDVVLRIARTALDPYPDNRSGELKPDGTSGYISESHQTVTPDRDV